jgi:cytochrome P450
MREPEHGALPGYDPHTLGGAPAAEREAIYHRMQADDPVAHRPDLDAWIVTRYRDVREILADREHFTARGSIGIDHADAFVPEVRAVLATGYDRFPGIIEMDPPVHTRYRQLYDGAFKPRRIAALEPELRDLADGLIDRFADDLQVDLVPAFAVPYPLGVMCRLLGVPAEDVDHVHRISAGFTALEAGTIHRLPLAEQVAFAELFVAFQQYCADLVADRRASPRDDLVSDLVGARLDDGRHITTEEAISTVIHLLFAGHETNARSLASTVHLLLSDRRQWERVLADPGSIPRVVEEGLRLEPPVTYHTRTTTRPVTIGGVDLPADAVVHLVFAAANRDEGVFHAPGVFDPDRVNGTRHLGFGWATHHCVGAPVARLESRVALEVLSQRLPDLRLAAPVVDFEPHAMLRGLAALPVEWG